MNKEELLKNISSLLKKHELFLNNNPEIFYAIEDRLIKAVDTEEDYDITDYPMEEQDQDGEDELSGYGEDLFDKPSYDEDSEDEDQQYVSGDEDENDAAAQYLAEYGADDQEEPTDSEEEQTIEEPKKASGRTWKPRSAYSAEHQKVIKEAMDQGHTHREAERIAGAHSAPTDFLTALKSHTDPSEPSARMLELLKPHAKKHVEDYSRAQMKNAEMEVNPVKHAAGKKVEAFENAHKDYEKDYNDFLQSDAVKDLTGRARHSVVQGWKKDWHEKNPEHREKAAEAANVGKIHNEAMNAAKGRREEEIKAVLGAGQSGGGTTGEYSQTAAGGDEGPVSSQVAGQTVGSEQGDEGSYSTNIKTDPYAHFAQQNPEYVKHLQEKQAKTAAAEQAKILANISPERKAKFTPEQKAKFDAHVSKLNPDQQARLSAIPDPTKIKGQP